MISDHENKENTVFAILLTFGQLYLHTYIIETSDTNADRFSVLSKTCCEIR